jgi:hypothetical protein
VANTFLTVPFKEKELVKALGAGGGEATEQRGALAEAQTASINDQSNAAALQ